MLVLDRAYSTRRCVLCLLGQKVLKIICSNDVNIQRCKYRIRSGNVIFPPRDLDISSSTDTSPMPGGGKQVCKKAVFERLHKGVLVTSPNTGRSNVSSYCQGSAGESMALYYRCERQTWPSVWKCNLFKYTTHTLTGHICLFTLYHKQARIVYRVSRVSVAERFWQWSLFSLLLANARHWRKPTDSHLFPPAICHSLISKTQHRHSIIPRLSVWTSFELFTPSEHRIKQGTSKTLNAVLRCRR